MNFGVYCYKTFLLLSQGACQMKFLETATLINALQSEICVCVCFTTPYVAGQNLVCASLK